MEKRVNQHLLLERAEKDRLCSPLLLPASVFGPPGADSSLRQEWGDTLALFDERELELLPRYEKRIPVHWRLSEKGRDPLLTLQDLLMVFQVGCAGCTRVEMVSPPVVGRECGWEDEGVPR